MDTRALLAATFPILSVDRLEILLEVGRIPVGAILGLFSFSFFQPRVCTVWREAHCARLLDTALKLDSKNETKLVRKNSLVNKKMTAVWIMQEIVRLWSETKPSLSIKSKQLPLFFFF